MRASSTTLSRRVTRDRDQRDLLPARRSPPASPSGATPTPATSCSRVKATRYATNRRVLGEAGESIERFVASGLAELGPKLGPIVWQFATTKAFDADDFDAFLKLLPARVGATPLRHAMEVRHPSFMCAGIPRAGAPARRRDGVRRFRRLPVVRRCHRRLRLCAPDALRIGARDRLSRRQRSRPGPSARGRGARAASPTGCRASRPAARRRRRATCSCSSSAARRSARRPRRWRRWRARA